MKNLLKSLLFCALAGTASAQIIVTGKGKIDNGTAGPVFVRDGTPNTVSLSATYNAGNTYLTWNQIYDIGAPLNGIYKYIYQIQRYTTAGGWADWVWFIATPEAPYDEHLTDTTLPSPINKYRINLCYSDTNFWRADWNDVPRDQPMPFPFVWASYLSSYNTVTVGAPPAPGQCLWLNAVPPTSGNTAIALDVATDASGNTCTVGWFSGSVNFNGTVLNSGSTLLPDGFIMKCNAQGIMLWVKQIHSNVPSNGGNEVNGVCFDSGGNIIVTGYFDATVNFGGTSLSSVTSITDYQPDIFIAKYSTDGTLLWVKGFGGSLDDRGVKVAVDGSDNVIFAAEINSLNVDFGSGITLSSSGYYDVVVGKLAAANGSTTWAVKFGGPSNNDMPYALAVDGSGDVFVAGQFYNGQMAKLSGSTGANVWTRSPGGIMNGITVTPSGVVVITGLAAGGNGIVMSGYDSTGVNNLWNVTTGTGTDAGLAVKCDGSGNLVLVGKASSGIRFAPYPAPFLVGNGQINGFIAVFTVSGTSAPVPVWAKNLGDGNTGSSGLSAVCQNSQGQVIAAGFWTGNINFGGPVGVTPGGFNGAPTVSYSR